MFSRVVTIVVSPQKAAQNEVTYKTAFLYVTLFCAVLCGETAIVTTLENVYIDRHYFSPFPALDNI